jgi:hypothetical protein
MKIFSREFRYKNTYFEMQVKTLIAEEKNVLIYAGKSKMQEKYTK